LALIGLRFYDRGEPKETPMSALAVEIHIEPEDIAPDALQPSSAETAECTCPDWCERDHDRD
jgi:hypothetical protein